MTANRSPGQRAAFAATAVLAIAAAMELGYWAWRGLQARDTEPMESPLMLSVARQLVSGPRGLYGPYGGSNPLVLIHAPLYYRAAASLAWPLNRALKDPVVAAQLAGRLISALGLLATMGAAYRLGRLGGLPRRAGLWAAALVAGSPVLAGQPVAVRPDMLGVALQSWGVALMLGSTSGGRRSILASVLFGLAACVKQHLVAGWMVGAAIALREALSGRGGWRTLWRVLLPGAMVSATIYGAEWWATGGRVWESAFEAASNVARAHPGDWDMVLILFTAIGLRSAGVMALLAASAFIAVGKRPGAMRWIATFASLVVLGILLGFVLAFTIRGTRWMGALALLAVCPCAAAALASSAFLLSRNRREGVDGPQFACLLLELAIVLVLAHTSAGAWVNYGIPALVFAAVLAARALSRALEGAPTAAAVPASLALGIALMTSIHGIVEAHSTDVIDRAKVRAIKESLDRPAPSIFFTSRPGLNRIDGRLELVYDDWLYPVFESSGLAERRSIWLRRALASGPVSVVVKGTRSPAIEGTTLDLRLLGYRPAGSLLSNYYIWVR